MLRSAQPWCAAIGMVMLLQPIIAEADNNGGPEGEQSSGVNHGKHGKEQCTSCHGEGVDADRRRPAADDHRACDTADCHAAEFYGSKAEGTKVCFVCHTSRDFWTDMRALVPFPPEHRDFYAEISHKLHLGREGGSESRVEKVTDQGCLFCHQIDADTKEVTRPGHEACKRCHADDVAKVPMSRCNGCHHSRLDAEGKPVATGPIARAGASRVANKFSHEKHRLDRRKKDPTPVSCGVCHLTVANAETLGSIEVHGGSKMMTTACGSCHRSGQKSADGKPVFSITGRCTLCHDSMFDTASVPASHRRDG
jgi:hypothetical protein